MSAAAVLPSPRAVAVPSLARAGADPAAIAAALRVILAPGQVTEVRALEATTPTYRRPHTVSGYFDTDHLDEAARAVAALNAKGVYFVPNPINRALLARTSNRLRDVSDRDPTTSDADILTRRWLLVDADPVRPAGISASDAEHAAALAVAREIRRYLDLRGWPAPIFSDSANGGHLMYSINLPADDGGLVQRVLDALAFKFNDKAVHIDQKVFNPSRLWKLYGTVGRKGDHTADRPHRLARLLEVPSDLVPVPRELLAELAAELPKDPDPRPVERHNGHGTFDLDRWVADRCPSDLIGPHPWRDGRRWIFRECPWNPEHRNRSAYIVEFPNGAIAAGCQHDGCASNDWHALRDRLEPRWRNDRQTMLSQGAPSRQRVADGASDTTPRRASIIRLSDVKPERVSWLWHGRIPLNKLTVLDGDPGLGKSAQTIDIAARVTTGRSMPDGAPSQLDGPAGVVFLTAEDGLGDTVRPRPEAAGGDAARVAVLVAVHDAAGERMPILSDLAEIEEAIRTVDAKLVIVDPLMAYLTSETNSYRDQDMRRLLAPIKALAERTGAAVLVVRHLNKMPGGEPIYRGGGSIGIIGAARSGLPVAKDPDDPTGRRRILASTKCNLAAEPPAIAYHLEAGTDEVVRVVWEGPSEHTAAGLLATPAGGEEKSAIDAAKEFLRDILEHERQPVKVIQSEAKAAGIAERTLDRAKASLCLKAIHEGTPGSGGRWFWTLPPKGANEAPKDANNASTAKVAPLAPLAPLGALGGEPTREEGEL